MVTAGCQHLQLKSETQKAGCKMKIQARTVLILTMGLSLIATTAIGIFMKDGTKSEGLSPHGERGLKSPILV